MTYQLKIARTMNESAGQITISEDDPHIGSLIESELLAALRDDSPQAQNTNFALSARDAQSTLIGGLTATTSYGWLLIKTLWIKNTHRRQGVGASLVEFAQDKARRIDCHSAWLDTSSADAMQFYRRLGYSVFAELANGSDRFPPGHRRWFMKMSL